MSIGMVVTPPQSSQKEEPIEDIALQFFSILHEKHHPDRSQSTKSPGPVHKVNKNIQSDGEVLEDDQEIQPNPAQVIAQKLIEMGDDLEKRLVTKELREEFERQFKLRSAFYMAYENFSEICQGYLSRARDRLNHGWEQIFVLYYGHYLVSEELTRIAGPENSQERIATTAHYLRDVIHDTGLEEWVQAQGGFASVGAVSGEQVVNVVPPEGTSVDK